MRRRRSAILVVLATMLLLVPSSALADSGAQTYNLVATNANFGVAANGDRVEVRGSGTFSINPTSVSASGTFTHRDAGGAVVGSGTWTATALLAFHSYGCGVLIWTDPDTILLPDRCGGILKLRVELVTLTGDTFDGILTFFCWVGEHLPASHTFPSGEGVTLNIPGVINFSHTDVGSSNVFIRTS